MFRGSFRIYTHVGLGDAVKLVNKKSANHSHIADLRFEYCIPAIRILQVNHSHSLNA